MNLYNVRWNDPTRRKPAVWSSQHLFKSLKAAWKWAESEADTHKEVVGIEPESLSEPKRKSLTGALVFAVTAPTDEQSARAVELAERMATYMEPEEVEACQIVADRALRRGETFRDHVPH
jgi:hypothetical protein